MADKKPAPVPLEKKPTWQDKLANREPLNSLEETKADADFNYNRRLREEKERKEYELQKAGQGVDVSDTDTGSTNDQKGNK